MQDWIESFLLALVIIAGIGVVFLGMYAFLQALGLAS